MFEISLLKFSSSNKLDKSDGCSNYIVNIMTINNNDH